MKILAPLFLLLAAQAANASTCSYEPGMEMPITLTGPALRPTMPGKINGTEQSMFLDTGAAMSALMGRAVERLGIPARRSMLSAVGMGGREYIQVASVRQWSIGPSKPSRGEFQVLGGTVGSFPYAALVGADFLLQADLELDIPNRRMQFHYPRNCGSSEQLVQGAIVVPLDSSKQDLRPHITIHINGLPIRALVDTGAPTSWIDIEAAKRAGISAATPGARSAGTTNGIGGRPTPAWSVPIAKMDIGQDSHANFTLRMAAMPNQPGAEKTTDAILGMDFLRSYRVLFARSQGKAYLTRTGHLKLVGSDADWAEMVASEAAKGNPGAILGLARLVEMGKGIGQDNARASALYAQAAALGEFDAQSHLATQDLAAGDFAKAAPSLRKLVNDTSANRNTDLMSYIATAHIGERETALNDLKQLSKRASDDKWPMPVVEYLLGEESADSLLRSARKQEVNAKGKECEARYYIGHANWLKGDVASARQWFDSAVSACESGTFQQRASTAALARLR